MAALTDAGAPDWARRVLMTLVRGLTRDPARESQKSTRYYPPRRDLVIEEAAMSREMFRL